MQIKEWLKSLVRNRAAELTGTALIMFALFIAVSIISYHPADPSANVATDIPAENWAGFAGAFAADLIMQFFGLAGILLIAVPLAWGIKLLHKKNLHMPSIRVALLLLAVPTLAALLKWIEAPISWPIQRGLGGVVGAVSKEALSSAIGSTTALIVLLLLFAALLYFAFGLKLREWQCVWHSSARGFSFIGTGVRLLRSIWMGRSEPAPEKEKKPRKAKVSYKTKTDPAEERAIPVLNTAADDAKKRVQTPAPRKKSAAAPQQSSFALPDGNGIFQLPPINILSHADNKVKRPTESSLEQNAHLLESVLSDFGVNGEIVKVRPGPVVTLYELEPAAGTKSARVIGLADDIARSMSAISARIAVIPGRNAIGIELPNANREMVSFRDMMEDDNFAKGKNKLALALGKDIGGDPVIADLAKMPHLLVAGTTGSGKSVAINTMIASLLYRMTPEECRFIMIDPKMLELSMYDGIPHLLSPVVTEPGKAVVALKWTVREMENRYRLMSNLGVRNIDGYNKRIIEAKAKGSQLTRSVQTGFDPDTGKPVIEEVPLDMNPLPYIVVIVDEMADLMLVAGKDIEASIQRLAQMARAAGIHIIMATQRPSVDVITGVIKANFPTRISFQVTSRIDSRTILGEQGAETLLGMGDMLYMAGGGRITRVHGPFVSDQEVETLVAFLKAQGKPEYIETITQEEDETSGVDGIGDVGGGSEEDQLFQQAVQAIVRDKKVSTSYIQRSLRIGYNRAADIMDRMEREGIVSPPNHAGKRELLLE
ncbi:MAG: DNA translocase FtsK 4TM domain-containing protein [Alphaproteobacteria bacterium]|nr:DNA translocase FtsK 4TM domain-containing protein [Alphaproteobacteria bacterium]